MNSRLNSQKKGSIWLELEELKKLTEKLFK